MTFWQDARPASPRVRVPRPPRRPRSGGWSRRKRRAALVLAAILVATGAASVVRVGGEATAKTTAVPAARRPSPRRPRVIVERWSRTLPDFAAAMRTSHGAAIVISDDWVTAISLDDGRVRWQQKTALVNPEGVVRGDTILLSTRTAFVALDRVTGAIRWLTETRETPGPVALVGPDAARQIAMVSTEEGGLVGLDSRTGRARWSVRLSGQMRGMPAADHGSGTVATVWQQDATSTQLRVIDAATGALRWEQDLALMSGSPIIASGVVAVSAGNGSSDSEVRAYALADGEPRWRAPVAAPSQPDLVPLVDGGDVVVVDQLGTVTRLALADGVLRWATHTEALETHVQPIRVDDAILLWNEVGEVVTLDRATGAIRARRRPAGLPVGLAATRRLVVVAQRLVERDAVLAFDAAALVAPARSRR